MSNMPILPLLLLSLTTLLQIVAEATSQPHEAHQAIVIRQEQQQRFRYGVIVDCGSSGTRAHIFRWPIGSDDEADNDLASTLEQMRDPINQKPLIERVSPGLSSLRDHPEMASDYMHPIMDFLSSNVPQESQHQTPVFFLGTAGLRLLDQATQKRILDDISRDLPRDYPNFPNLFTRVISGGEEGFYQWLSINKLADRLAPRYDLKRAASEFYCQAPRSRRYGLIEMGGASVQISYELSDQVDRIVSRWLQSDALAIRAYRESQIEFHSDPTRRRRIFSATFLGFGSNNARHLTIALLIREALQAGSTSWRPPIMRAGLNSTLLLLEDPCLPIGSLETTSGHSPRLLFDATLPIDYEEKTSDSRLFVQLYGGGNFARCQRLLNKVLVVAKQQLINCYLDPEATDRPDSAQEPCTTHLLGKNFIPFHLFQFLGLGDFYYTTELMIQHSGQFKLDSILGRAIRICSTPYRILIALYPEANRVDKDRVRQECFKATWMLTLLRIGFRMPSGSDFRTISEINGQTLDWTTGAMIVRLSDARNHLDRVQSPSQPN